MTDKQVTERIELLERKYREVWGVEVDYLTVPACMTQEKLVCVLERIIDTGESVLVGFNKIYRGQ
ncbi:MAG: hypothetical protein E7559_07645 [Ruminococcaceae bacterium]|nr:hypothetical protein [Oscillospiraceae bacterium]